jgi:hypothetical protein
MMPGVTSGDLQDMEALHEQEKTDAIFNQQDPVSGAARQQRTPVSSAPSANKA